MRIQREKMFADPAMKLKVSHDSAALSQGYLNNAYADLREAQKELYERESLTWLDQLTPWLSISLMLLGTGISVYTARKIDPEMNGGKRAWHSSSGFFHSPGAGPPLLLAL